MQQDEGHRQGTQVQHVFIIGSKGLGNYGGYETFVDKLTEYHQDYKSNKTIKYYVACKENGNGSLDMTKLEGVSILSDNEFLYHNAHCFTIRVPNIGAAQAIYYDVKALNECCKYIKKHHIQCPIVYILACRIGPFAAYFYKKLHKFDAKIYLNPDGHEWMRAKWSKPIQKYWRMSEKMMVKYCDLVICDSINIEKYIHKCYDKKGIRGESPKTTFIAYGAETRKSILSDDDKGFVEWLEKKQLKPGNYYLAVGRFVPENNYSTMIEEFMKSHSKRDFAIITTANDSFLEELEKKLHFKKDPRIKFVGTVYDQELLMKIRENAYGYFHGHEVGGTNPSLLEAMSSTKLNLLFNVGFNREVAGNTALYWSKEAGNLAGLVDTVDQFSEKQIDNYGKMAKQRIRKSYSWEFISNRYAEEFLRE